MNVLNKILNCIRYRNIDNKCFHMQGVIGHFPSAAEAAKRLTDELSQRVGAEVVCRELNIADPKSFEGWCGLINNSYDDCFYDTEKAFYLFNTHPYLNNLRCYVFETQQVVQGG